MAYITTTQLSDRLGATLYARLTDRVNGTTPNAAAAQQIVDEAEAEANAYLARRYRTPVDLHAHDELRALLEARVLDLAEYNAWRGSPFISDPPLRVQQARAAAIRWLEDVSTGRLFLPAAKVPESTHATDSGLRHLGRPRAFTGAELDGL